MIRDPEPSMKMRLTFTSVLQRKLAQMKAAQDAKQQEEEIKNNQQPASCPQPVAHQVSTHTHIHPPLPPSPHHPPTVPKQIDSTPILTISILNPICRRDAPPV